MANLLAVVAATLSSSLDLSLPKKGDYVYHRWLRNTDGSPQRFKVTSVQHNRTGGLIKVGLKRGLREYGSLTTPYDLRAFTTDPKDVLPPHLRCGCNGTENVELFEGEEILYCWGGSDRGNTTWNFARRCEEYETVV